MKKTTAIYPNRKRDKESLEGQRQLPEFGENVHIKFYTPKGPIVANGYERILYGDHGPYIEFIPDQVSWEKLNCVRKGKGYYNKWFSEDGIMFYEQLRDVKHMPNPPKDGNPKAFRGNRKEGYADYKPGMVYVAPDQIRSAKLITGRKGWDAIFWDVRKAT